MSGAVVMMAVAFAAAPGPMVDTIDVDAIHQILEERARGWTNREIRSIATAIHEASARAKIDPRLVLGIMHTESNFIRGAKSGVGARGLLQLMPATAEAFAAKAGFQWRGIETLHNPVANVHIGVTYFAFLLKKFRGNTDLALTAYCHGPAKLLRTLKAEGRLQPGTWKYSKKVKASYARFRARTEALALTRSEWRPHGPLKIEDSSQVTGPQLAQLTEAVTSMQTVAALFL
jgi:soluble lytic murein transglycosylase-like protein